jgi:hypothetical protein
MSPNLFDPGKLDPTPDGTTSVPWPSTGKFGELTRTIRVAIAPHPGGSATQEEATVTAIKQTVTIQSGGRVEVISGELPEGHQAEVIILVDPSRETHRPIDPVRDGLGPLSEIRATDPSINTGHDAGTSQPEGQDQEYPTADFIEPTEYDWDINKFIAEQAVREYLRDSHADH